MSGADLLLDTNAVIAWIKQDRKLAAAVMACSAPAMPLITLGELLFGALKSAKPAQNKAVIEAARGSFGILLPSERTPEIYASVRYELRRKGKPIPENDLWIAALAIERSLPLLTRDAHFHEVEGLTVVSW